MTATVRLGDFVPRRFAICADDTEAGTVIAWGLTLPDGSAVAVAIDPRHGGSCAASICRSPARAAFVHGGDLHWLDAQVE